MVQNTYTCSMFLQLLKLQSACRIFWKVCVGTKMQIWHCSSYADVIFFVSIIVSLWSRRSQPNMQLFAKHLEIKCSLQPWTPEVSNQGNWGAPVVFIELLQNHIKYSILQSNIIVICSISVEAFRVNCEATCLKILFSIGLILQPICFCLEHFSWHCRWRLSLADRFWWRSGSV